MKVSVKWFWEAAGPIWQRLLRLYDGHKVLTLSVLNTVSLFLFALIALTAWAGGGGEASAGGADLASRAPEASPAEPPEARPPPLELAPAVKPAAREVAEASRARQAGKKPIGRREYPVEVRRKLRVYTRDELELPPHRPEEPAWAAEMIELSEERPAEPEFLGQP